MTSEEIILHTLFESGIARMSELERFVKDDILRYGNRLSELEKKLASAYSDAVSTLCNHVSSLSLSILSDFGRGVGRRCVIQRGG